MNTRPIYMIATEIRQDWKKIHYSAKPYLEAMYGLNKITDKYGFDSADSIVRYFLINANTWKGEKARAIKSELRNMLKMA